MAKIKNGLTSTFNRYFVAGGIYLCFVSLALGWDWFLVFDPTMTNRQGYGSGGVGSSRNYSDGSYRGGGWSYRQHYVNSNWNWYPSTSDYSGIAHDSMTHVYPYWGGYGEPWMDGYRWLGASYLREPLDYYPGTWEPSPEGTNSVFFLFTVARDVISSNEWLGVSANYPRERKIQYMPWVGAGLVDAYDPAGADIYGDEGGQSMLHRGSLARCMVEFRYPRDPNWQNDFSLGFSFIKVTVEWIYYGDGVTCYTNTYGKYRDDNYHYYEIVTNIYCGTENLVTNEGWFFLSPDMVSINPIRNFHFKWPYKYFIMNNWQGTNGGGG